MEISASIAAHAALHCKWYIPWTYLRLQHYVSALQCGDKKSQCTTEDVCKISCTVMLNCEMYQSVLMVHFPLDPEQPVSRAKVFAGLLWLVIFFIPISILSRVGNKLLSNWIWCPVATIPLSPETIYGTNPQVENYIHNTKDQLFITSVDLQGEHRKNVLWGPLLWWSPV